MYILPWFIVFTFFSIFYYLNESDIEIKKRNYSAFQAKEDLEFYHMKAKEDLEFYHMKAKEDLEFYTYLEI